MLMPHVPSMPGLTRRGFINLAGSAGGLPAVYSTMVAMGLLPVPAAYAGPPLLPPAAGRGKRVVILGAGIAGMTAAHELVKAGFECVVLEARERPGGRCWTLRGGDRVEESDSVQTVRWNRAGDLYFNPGPARLPQHHTAILGYCKELGVPLQPIINDNRNALLHDPATFDGKPVRLRQVANDLRGHIAELLAKALYQGALDQTLSTADKVSLLALVRGFGRLQPDHSYHGSARAGFAELPGAGTQWGRLNEPLALKAITSNAFWREASSFGEQFDQAATMLQPVGGMDRIATAFAKGLGGRIRFDKVVTEIRRVGEAKARIVYRDRRSKAESAIEADFVLVTLPLKVLGAIAADFSPRHKAAIATAGYMPAVKVAFEAKRRFWEEDEQIYGGISWTTQDITQIWYPSTRLQAASGILVGAYIWTAHIGDAFARLSPAERLELALGQGEKLHPTYRADTRAGVAVAWSKIPFSEGAWCEWTPEARRSAYPVLLEPDGPLFLAGEHLSNLPGWQEGAVLSAQAAVKQIAERAAARR
jgi:monoamine oxidase